MNKETTNSHAGAAGLLFLLTLPFVVIFSDSEYKFVLALVIITALALTCLFVKEGFIANDSGITFWKWWKIRTHFDYNSIHSIDVKVKFQRVGKGGYLFHPVFTMVMTTDRGKFRFMDSPNDYYERKECRDPDKINVVLENSDLMRLKKYIEEHRK